MVPAPVTNLSVAVVTMPAVTIYCVTVSAAVQELALTSSQTASITVYYNTSLVASVCAVSSSVFVAPQEKSVIACVAAVRAVAAVTASAVVPANVAVLPSSHVVKLAVMVHPAFFSFAISQVFVVDVTKPIAVVSAVVFANSTAASAMTSAAC